MPKSPLADSSKVVDLTLYSEGKKLDPSINITSVTVTSTINKIPFARIELQDGDMPNKKFPLSDGNDFDPGKEIKIEAGYGQQQATIFEGIVVKHSIRVGGENDSRLLIECRDKAVKMTVGRHNANFVDKKDSDIISQLIGDYAGLTPDVDATSIKYEKLVQYYCSDWDFLLSRAEVNGLLVIVDSGKFTVKLPDTSKSAELKLTYGEDLIELHADIDARSQLSEVESSSWDPQTQDLVQDKAPPKKLNDQGDLDSKKLASVLGLKSFQLQTIGARQKAELKTWAEAQQLKAGLARIRGRMKFQGSATAKPGTLIELEGVGDHFNGSVFVSSVSHQISQGNWITEVAFGLAPDWFAEQRDLMAPPASGLLPGVDGLQIGLVTKVNEDPENSYRIQVKLPLLKQGDTEPEPIWARLANFYASAEFGVFFLPEIGDEVLLGFLNSDPTAPIVLGSLYSSKLKAPYEADENNNTKGIVTRSQLRIEFDEDKKITTIITPGGNQDTKKTDADGCNKVVLNDEQKSILLQDQTGNKVELSESGIVFESPKDISISAKGKITLDATGEIAISSKADVSAEGMNVNLEAKTGLSAKGNATAELSASGQTTIKGAMVMIN